MALSISQWLALFCVCGFGIQCTFSFIAEMNDVMQNCRRDGGFCINTIPPPPPRPRGQPRGRGRGRGRGGPGPTQTRKGTRPSARDMGATHQRLPASAGSAPPGGAPYPPPAPAGGAPYQPPSPNAPQPSNDPFGFGFPSSPNDPFGGMMPFMFFTRRKRQAAEPMEPHEIPRIRRGENMFNFLNQHCRKSEFDFGCRKEGGTCCLPHLK